MEKQILVIDDDESYIYLFKRKLTKIAPEVVFKSCSTGQEALNYLENIPEGERLPDVVLLDLNMPVMDGFDFLKRLTELCDQKRINFPPPRLLVVTSSDADSDREKATQFKITMEYLVKPINMDKISKALQAS